MEALGEIGQQSNTLIIGWIGIVLDAMSVQENLFQQLSQFVVALVILVGVANHFVTGLRLNIAVITGLAPQQYLQLLMII